MLSYLLNGADVKELVFMDMGEARNSDSSEIKEYPENYEEMIQKLQDREEEQLKKILVKRKAETYDELKAIATKAIVKRATRSTGEYKPLKDRTVIKEARSEDIETLRQQLSEEINAIGQRIIQELRGQLPSLQKKIIGLKGRVHKGPPAA